MASKTSLRTRRHRAGPFRADGGRRASSASAIAPPRRANAGGGRRGGGARPPVPVPPSAGRTVFSDDFKWSSGSGIDSSGMYGNPRAGSSLAPAGSKTIDPTRRANVQTSTQRLISTFTALRQRQLVGGTYGRVQTTSAKLGAPSGGPGWSSRRRFEAALRRPGLLAGVSGLLGPGAVGPETARSNIMENVIHCQNSSGTCLGGPVDPGRPLQRAERHRQRNSGGGSGCQVRIPQPTTMILTGPKPPPDVDPSTGTGAAYFTPERGPSGHGDVAGGGVRP